MITISNHEILNNDNGIIGARLRNMPQLQLNQKAKIKKMEIIEIIKETGERVKAKNRITLQLNEVNLLNGILTEGFFSDIQTTELNIDVDNTTQLSFSASKFLSTDTDGKYLIAVNFLIEY